MRKGQVPQLTGTSVNKTSQWNKWKSVYAIKHMSIVNGTSVNGAKTSMGQVSMGKSAQWNKCQQDLSQ